MSDLDNLRIEIDEITQEMMTLFEKRLIVSKQIAHYKKSHGLAIFQPEREQALIERYCKECQYPELSKAFLENLMALGKQLQKEEIKQ